MKFIKDSFRELKHVVWPTKEETFKYFLIVLAILVFFGLYLFVFATIFGNGLTSIKNIVNPTVTSQNYNSTIDGIIPTSTGSTSSGIVSPAVTSTGTITVNPVLIETNTGAVETETQTGAIN